MAGGAWAQPPSATIRIMPLGDSITDSHNGRPSYRYPLWINLFMGGYAVDFVGSRYGHQGQAVGYNFDQNHEGHNFFRADQVLPNVQNWAQAAQPDVVLLHLGTNDVFQSDGNDASGYVDTATNIQTINELSQIIDRLRSARPNVKVLLATLIGAFKYKLQTQDLNGRISALAGQKNTSASPVYLVDQWQGFDPATDTYDGVHPNESGERKMADKWYAAIVTVLRNAARESETAQGLSVDPLNRVRLLWGSARGRADLWRLSDFGGVENGVSFGPYAGFVARDIAAGPDSRGRALWTHDDGRAALWETDSANSLRTYAVYGPYPGWRAVDVALGPDIKSRLVWSYLDGTAGLWTVLPGGVVEGATAFGPYPGWRVRAVSTGGDNKMRLLWNEAGGQVSLWTVTAAHALEGSVLYGPFAGWEAADLATAPDNRSYLLWRHTNGSVGVWRVSAGGAIEDSASFGPYAGWSGASVSVGGDNKARLLWTHTDGRANVWTLTPGFAIESQHVHGPR
uniref:SGNH hydrolase-type esterase domain-containing protein n=1 Tax=uncultured Armatimonadetes bacterium TaxID=157466 RepID=A0A6J4I1P6_9BACT|nr:hypothetical protein AVDCRST_MAG63-1497 [uncultured Armatimonadetes bacterium]